MEDFHSLVGHSSQDIQVHEERNSRTRDVNTVANNSSSLDILLCFVCDAKIQGRHYALATCRTQSSRARVIEKLGELVGESYMVVISEDDVICRSCANLINTLDRLETEIKSVKGTVLRYLERKYCLEDGELLNNNESVKHSHPPQVTTSDENEKKRKAVNLLDESVCKNKQKKPIWLQCDKCRYTTNYNTFMIHHIRQHVNQKINCDKCGIQFIGNNQNNSHNCKEKQKQTEKNNQSSSVEINTGPECRNENEPFDNSAMTGASLPILTDQDDSFSLQIQAVEKKENDIKVFHLSDPENLQLEEVETHEGNLGEEEFNLEQENITDNPKPIISVDANSIEDFDLQKRDLTSKQILTVGEDGSLEMMEVEAWEEKNSCLKEHGTES